MIWGQKNNVLCLFSAVSMLSGPVEKMLVSNGFCHVDLEGDRRIQRPNKDVSKLFFFAAKRLDSGFFHLFRLVTGLVEVVISIRLPKLGNLRVKIGEIVAKNNWSGVPALLLGGSIEFFTEAVDCFIIIWRYWSLVNELFDIVRSSKPTKEKHHDTDD